MLLTNLDELHHAVRRIALDINTLMTAAEDRLDSTSKNEEILALINLKKCVQSAASVISSASTSLGLDYSEHFSVVPGSDFEDCFPSQPSPTMLRWMSSNTVYEFAEDHDTNKDIHGGRVSPGKTVALSNVAEDIHNSDSDSDLEYEIVQALMFSGKEKLAAADLGGAERLFRNCLSRMPSSGSLASIRRSSRTEKSEVISILLEIYLKQENWSEAQSLLIRKMALGSRGISKDDGQGLSDMLTLVQVLFRKQAHAEALLYGRRALKGYRKLGSAGTAGVERALRLLIQVCHADHNVDEEEAYSAILDKHLATAPPVLDQPAADPVLTTKLQTSPFSLNFNDRLKRGDPHQFPAATINPNELSTKTEISPILPLPPITKTILQSGDVTVTPSSEFSSEWPINPQDQDGLIAKDLKRNSEFAHENASSIQLSARRSPSHIRADPVVSKEHYEGGDAPTIIHLPIVRSAKEQAIVWTSKEGTTSHRAASDAPSSIHRIESEMQTLLQSERFDDEVSVDHMDDQQINVRAGSRSSHFSTRDEPSPPLVANFDMKRDDNSSLSEFSTASEGFANLIPSSKDVAQEKEIDVGNTVSPGPFMDTDAVPPNYHESALEGEASRGKEEAKLTENFHPNKDEDPSNAQNWFYNTMGGLAERGVLTDIDGGEYDPFSYTNKLSTPIEPARPHSFAATNKEDLDLSTPTGLAVGDDDSFLVDAEVSTKPTPPRPSRKRRRRHKHGASTGSSEYGTVTTEPFASNVIHGEDGMTKGQASSETSMEAMFSGMESTTSQLEAGNWGFNNNRATILEEELEKEKANQPHPHVLCRSYSAPQLTYCFDASRYNVDGILTWLHYSGLTRTSTHSGKSTGNDATTTHAELADAGGDGDYVDWLRDLRARLSIIRARRQGLIFPPMTVVPLIPEPQQKKLVLIGDGAVGKTALLR